MMFVPEYYVHIGDPKMDRSDSHPVRYLGVFENFKRDIYLDKDGTIFNQSIHGRRRTPITFPCPYCGAELHQNEKVECKCGCKIIALDDEIYLTIQEAGGLEKMRVKYINHICWLQIQEAKE